MRFADELADLDTFRFPSSEGIRKPELAMARQLIEHLSAKWDPEKYTDEYRDNLMRIIQARLKGKKPTLVGRETPREGNVIDLMERLRASLQGRDSGKGARKASQTRRRGATETSAQPAASKPKKGPRKPSRRVA
jgi:DNA end-binding protein Ku